MLRILLACVLVATSALAYGHKPSDSYLTLEVAGAEVQGQWDVALRDLDLALALDADQDGAITWGEVRTRHADIAAYALSHLKLASDGKVCSAAPAAQLIDRHSDGAYTVLRFTAHCPHAVSALDVTYNLLFDLDPQHRGLLKLGYGGQLRTAIFSPEAPSQSIVLSEPNRLRQFADYVSHGVWHIWIGFDHILFLLSLLLPAVLVRSGTKWQPAVDFKSTFLDVVKVVTAFTLAHSITLTLAALGVVTLPSRLVESAIAASVVLAALNNIYPIVSERRWVLAFVFGLVHGFGFASVLADLGLPHGALLIALVAFNVGVELGQLAIVTVFLPLAWWLRASWAYRGLTLYAGSAAVMVLAFTWLLERAFDLRLLS
ncbi:MAG: HupE/UreJ family protein [Betaproteobacteria bacterium]